MAIGKKQFVSELREGDLVFDFFAVKFKKPPRDYKNGQTFEIRVCDKSGEITAKYWGSTGEDVSAPYNSFGKDDVVKINGLVTSFKERLEIAINPTKKGSITKVKIDRQDTNYFVETLPPERIDSMFSRIMEFVRMIKDERLKSLAMKFFQDQAFVSEFKACPASMARHQNYIGGLVEHSLHMAEICMKIKEVHPSLDLDLLIFGAIFHDIGKIREFRVATSIDISQEGMLRGHTVIGDQMVMEKIREIPNFPEILRNMVSHIMLSHHGKTEFGAPKEPQFPEAFVIHALDELDAQVDQLIKIKEGADTEDEWIWVKKDNRHVFISDYKI